MQYKACFPAVNAEVAKGDIFATCNSLKSQGRPRLIVPIRGLGDPNAYVAIPIGPHKLFIGARKPDFLNKLKSEKHINVVKAINKAVVEQAREYVWGDDASQLSFVEKHFGKAPDRIIIDEDTKAKAMAAARGELAQDSQSLLDADAIARR